MLLVGLLLNVALAHQPGLSYAQVTSDQLVETFSGAELRGRAPPRGAVSVDGAPCVVGAPTVTNIEADGVQSRAPLDCPAGIEWSYQADYLSTLSPGHRHYLEAFGQPVAVLDASAPQASFSGAEDTASIAAEFVQLGVEHIWTGYDHLAFLLALLLIASSLREMLGIVTGFTLAHSVTLTLAALGVIAPPASVVEPAIALTIAYAGLENLWHPSPRRRFLVTSSLGLIHGFGFAGLLLDLGLPRAHLLTALVSFNGGVEIGQAAVVMVTLPLLLWLSRRPQWTRRAVPAISLLIAAAGVFWFVQRVLPLG